MIFITFFNSLGKVIAELINLTQPQVLKQTIWRVPQGLINQLVCCRGYLVKYYNSALAASACPINLACAAHAKSINIALVR